MGRRLRFVPEGGALVEITCRTLQGRFLLKPSAELRSIVVGVLARSQKLFAVKIHAYVFLSNHYHLLLSVDDASQMAGFMNYLNSNLAREAGRLHNWQEKFWGRRYQAIVVSDEERAQVDRLRYLLSHGCKEGLVARPQNWPGAQCVLALMEGKSLRGQWFDRTREYAARNRKESFRSDRYATEETLRIEPMPCWSDRPIREQQERVRELVQEIEVETAARHSRKGSLPLGQNVILRQNPHTRPERLKKVWAPAFHAGTKAARQGLVEGYRWFVAAYRKAASRLREGHPRPCFPPGSFPPRLPFVSWVPELTPG